MSHGYTVPVTEGFPQCQVTLSLAEKKRKWDSIVEKIEAVLTL